MSSKINWVNYSDLKKMYGSVKVVAWPLPNQTGTPLWGVIMLEDKC